MLVNNLYIMQHTIYSVHEVYPDLFSSQIVTSLVQWAIGTFSAYWCHVRILTLSLPGVISHDFLLQSLTRDISYSMENMAFDSLLR